MYDEYVQRRAKPRAELAAQLQARPREQSGSRPRRGTPSRTRSFFVLAFLGGTAFAFTLAVRGVPAQLVHFFHRDASPGVSTRMRFQSLPAVEHAVPARMTLPSLGAASQVAPQVPSPAAGASTSPAPVAPLPSNSALSGSATPVSGPAAAGPWQYFLHGESAPLLRGWIHEGLPAGWEVHDGVLSKSGIVEDLESTRMYRDFVLELQWTISAGGDSGIFYRGTHEYPRIWLTGPEYQLVDDSYVGTNRLVATGAVFGIYPSPAGVMHPPGEWNSTRIVVQGNYVEYWLNGQPIVRYTLGSYDWMLRVNDSKFAAVRDYGRATRGLIGLQGTNNGSLEVRHMRIRVLP